VNVEHSIKNTRKYAILEVMFFNGFSVGMQSFVLLSLAIYFNMSSFFISVVSSLPTAGYLLQIFTKRVNTILGGRRRTLVLSVTISRLVICLLPFAVLFDMRNQFVYFMIMFIYGLSSPFVNNVWTATMVEIINKKERGKYFGKRNLFSSLSTVVYTLFYGYVLSLPDKKSSILLLTSVMAVSAIGSAVFMYLHYIPDLGEEVKNISDSEIIKQMVGRELSNIYPPKNDVEKGEVILKVDNLTSIHENIFRNCSFELRRGEILGFGGLGGAGRSELMEAVFGLRSIKSGKVYMKGKEQTISRPKDAIKDGLGMITEDRRGTGILGCLSIADNVAISSLNNYLIAGIALDDGKIKKVVDENVSKLSIKTPSNKTLIQSLSGGNQQKVIIAREVTNDSDLLIAVNPTRGLDVGAIEFVHKYLVEQRNKDKAVLLVSFELDEIMNLSD